MAPRGASFWRGATRIDLDLAEVNRVIADLDASADQVAKSMRRAISRTGTTLKLRTSKAAVSELEIRRTARFRKRLKQMRSSLHKSGGQIGVWVGLNDLEVSALRGRLREFDGGATFRSREYHGAFVAKIGRYRSIYKRRGADRFPVDEQRYPIKDQIDAVLERDVLPSVAEIFLKNFLSDLRARTVFGVGRGA